MTLGALVTTLMGLDCAQDSEVLIVAPEPDDLPEGYPMSCLEVRRVSPEFGCDDPPTVVVRIYADVPESVYQKAADHEEVLGFRDYRGDH